MSFLSLNQSPHPLSDRSGDISSGAELVMLSAASEGALTALVAQLYGYLQTRPEVSLADVAHSFSQATAVAKEHRLSIVADSRERLLACLQAATAGRLEKGVLRSQAPGTAPPGSGVVFIFPGQGSQWLGMGRQLLRQEAVFAQALQACDRAILAESGWSVLEELAASEAVSRIERVDVTQPLIFSIAVALSALWKSWGVVPSCVVGHSLGEVAAAYVAGSLSMAEAAAVICRCSRMMHRISGQGAMAVVELGYQKTEEALRGCAGRVNLALSNSPKSTVISGEKEAMAELLIKLEAQGIFCRRIKTDVAGHTPQLDKVREQMLELLGELHSRKPAVPMFSTVTAKEVGEGELTGHYFFDTVRKPIRFSQVIGLLAERGYEIFVEISPHPLLTTSVQETLEATGKSALTIGSLRRGQPERELLLQGLGALWGRGLPVTPSAFFKAGGALAQIRTELLDLAGKAESESAEKESLLHMGWEAAPHPSGAGKVDPGRWLILGDGAGLGAALRAALSSAGHRAVLAVARTRKPQKDAWVVDDTSAVRLRALLGEAFSGQAPTGIIHLRCLDGQELGEESFEEELEGILERSGDALLALLQALSEKKPRLYLVTRGAQALGDADVSIAAAPLVGLGRVLGREHPEWRSTLVDLDPAAPGDETGPLLSELQSGSEEEEVAFRAGVRYVGRLSRGLGAAPSQKPALAIRSDGTYLIVGGLGRLGLTVAGFLAERGAGHLVLASLAGVRTAGQKAAIAAMEGRGTRVRIAKLDVCDRTQVERLLLELAALDSPLRGVVHAAAITSGMSEEVPLLRQNPARLRGVLAPRVLGANHLHELTQKMESLELYLLCTSSAGLLGSLGQASHAAADLLASALVQRRRAMGLPGVCVGFGSGDLEVEECTDGGIATAPEYAMLGRILASGAGNIGLFKFAARRWVEGSPPAASHRRFARLVDGLAPRSEKSLLERLREAGAAEREVLLSQFLCDQLKAMLQARGDESIDLEASLASLGVDSLMAIELRNRIGSTLGVSMPAALLLTLPTISAIYRFLLKRGFSSTPAAGQAGPSGGAEGIFPVEEVVHAIRFQPVATPRVRLFCFHGAGGSPEIFGSWPRLLPGDVEVIGMWHERQAAGQRITGKQYFEEFCSLLRRHDDAPFALCGYSAGGVLAFRLAAALAKRADVPRPIAIVPIVSPLSNKKANDALMQNPEQIKELLFGRRATGRKKAIEQIMMDADVDCSLIYDLGGFPGDKGGQAETIATPIIAFGGDADSMVPAAVTQEWGTHSSESFHPYIFAGDHLFMLEEANLGEILSKALLHIDEKRRSARAGSTPIAVA